MTELEKMQRAKMYVDKLANGVDPLTDNALAENDIVCNVRIARCLFYVSEVLGRVIGNGGEVGARTHNAQKTVPFSLTEEQISRFEYSDTPIYISDINDRINRLINSENMKKLKLGSLAGWLTENNYLYIETTFGKQKKFPTQRGFDIGIITEERTGMYGDYKAVLYNIKAQRFIIGNIAAIMEFNRTNFKNITQNQ